MLKSTLEYNCANIISEIYFSDFINSLEDFVFRNSYHKMVLIGDACLESYAPVVNNKKLTAMYLDIAETNKSLNTVSDIVSFLLDNDCGRDTLLIAYGGGVINDLVGTVASLYMRGIDWVNIPTTLLAQVDAAVGGKVAINHNNVKNLLGSFYPPKAIFINSKYLATLKDRDFYAAISEIVKYSLIHDKNLLSYIEENVASIINRDSDVISYLIKNCIEIKHKIVSPDLLDNNQRKVLNFGHSFAHAVEAVSELKYLHGEAVALGILMALKFSEYYFNTKLPVNRIFKLWGEFKLPSKVSLDISQFKNALLLDKKNRKGNLNLILLREIEKPETVIINNVEDVIDKLVDWGLVIN